MRQGEKQDEQQQQQQQDQGQQEKEEEEEESGGRKVVEKSTESKTKSLSYSDNKNGQLVWVKFKYDPWWPAQTCEAADAEGRAREAGGRERLVFSFGNHRYTWAKVDKIADFEENITLHSNPSVKPPRVFNEADKALFKDALNEANQFLKEKASSEHGNMNGKSIDVKDEVERTAPKRLRERPATVLAKRISSGARDRTSSHENTMGETTAEVDALSKELLDFEDRVPWEQVTEEWSDLRNKWMVETEAATSLSDLRKAVLMLERALLPSVLVEWSSSDWANQVKTAKSLVDLDALFQRFKDASNDRELLLSKQSHESNGTAPEHTNGELQGGGGGGAGEYASRWKNSSSSSSTTKNTATVPKGKGGPSKLPRRIERKMCEHCKNWFGVNGQNFQRHVVRCSQSYRSIGMVGAATGKRKGGGGGGGSSPFRQEETNGKKSRVEGSSSSSANRISISHLLKDPLEDGVSVPNSIPLDKPGLYSAGLNKTGQLGIDKMIEKDRKPTLIKKLQGECIVDLSCGVGQCAVLRDDGVIYTWGCNTHGQAFLPKGASIYSPAIPPSLIETGRKFVSVVCGGWHTVALTDEGEVFTSGDQDHAQLGREGTSDAPGLVTNLKEEKVVQAACGALHTVVLTQSAKVYSWGWNGHGQLGYRTSKQVDIMSKGWVPLEVPFMEKITHVSCGGRHTMAIGESGTLYGWGSSEKGQLGCGKDDQHFPTPVPGEVAQERVKMVSCGGWHTVVVTRENRVYSWGWNRYGQLGIGDQQDRSFPKRVAFFNDKKIRQIICGEWHSSAVTEDEDIYMWGWAGVCDTELNASPLSERVLPVKMVYRRGPGLSYSIAAGSGHSLLLVQTSRDFLYSETWRSTQGPIQSRIDTAKVTVGDAAREAVEAAAAAAAVAATSAEAESLQMIIHSKKSRLASNNNNNTKSSRDTLRDAVDTHEEQTEETSLDDQSFPEFEVIPSRPTAPRQKKPSLRKSVREKSRRRASTNGKQASVNDAQSSDDDHNSVDQNEWLQSLENKVLKRVEAGELRTKEMVLKLLATNDNLIDALDKERKAREAALETEQKARSNDSDSLRKEITTFIENQTSMYRNMEKELVALRDTVERDVGFKTDLLKEMTAIRELYSKGLNR